MRRHARLHARTHARTHTHIHSHANTHELAHAHAQAANGAIDGGGRIGMYSHAWGMGPVETDGVTPLVRCSPCNEGEEEYSTRCKGS